MRVYHGLDENRIAVYVTGESAGMDDAVLLAQPIIDSLVDIESEEEPPAHQFLGILVDRAGDIPAGNYSIHLGAGVLDLELDASNDSQVVITGRSVGFFENSTGVIMFLNPDFADPASVGETFSTLPADIEFLETAPSTNGEFSKFFVSSTKQQRRVLRRSVAKRPHGGRATSGTHWGGTVGRIIPKA